MNDQPKRRGRRLGIRGILLIAIAAVVVSTLVVVFGMCRGGQAKPLGPAAFTSHLLALRRGDGLAWCGACMMPFVVLVAATAMVLAFWLA